jgi:hypothetical protein
VESRPRLGALGCQPGIGTRSGYLAQSAQSRRLCASSLGRGLVRFFKGGEGEARKLGHHVFAAVELPEAHGPEAYERVVATVYEHVYESYWGEGKSKYSEAAAG